MSVIKWTSVELLHHVRKGLEQAHERLGDEFVYPVVEYLAKVKLDGTNGAVQVSPSGQVSAQSRSRMLTLDDDNMGFASWVHDNRGSFSGLARPGEQLVIFGEWCGQGIQKRTAISRIERRVFAIFALQYGDHQCQSATLEVEPERIRARLEPHPEIFVLPWYGDSVVLDFGDRDMLERSASTINEMVAAVEACDPWVQEQFGICGLGEGIVFYPRVAADQRVLRETYTELMFKAKGEAHQVVKQKRPAQLDPEVAAGVTEFVELFVTPQRLEQGVTQACAGRCDIRSMGHFLKWLGQDVKKESAVELEAAGLDWKHVSKAVTNAAKRWYMERATVG